MQPAAAQSPPPGSKQSKPATSPLGPASPLSSFAVICQNQWQPPKGTKITPTSPLSDNSIKPVMMTDNQLSIRTHWVYMEPIELTGQIYSDQIGKFPITSSRVSKYIMIVYDFDSNAILSEPLKSRNEH